MTCAEKIRIDELVVRLQGQADLPLWVFASSATIISIKNSEQERFGPRGIWFSRLFDFLGLSNASEHALALLGGIVATVWWIQCRKLQQNFGNVNHLFIGFGAGPEKQMAERFRIEVNIQVAHLDQTSPKSLAQVAKPRLSAIWRTSFYEARKAVRGLRIAADTFVVRDYAKHWLVSAAIRFSDYVFIRAWAEELPKHVKRLVFISADVPAFAVLDSPTANRLSIEYRQHGFLNKSIIFPPFHHILALNGYEAAHMSKRIPSAQVAVSTQNIYHKSIDKLKPVLLFASIYDTGKFQKADHVSTIQSIVQKSVEKGLLVVVRKHPCETGSYWKEHFPNIELEESGRNFLESLELNAPMFVISWWSTCLLDALKAGILPVLIMNGSEAALEDMVFPLADIALNWPRDVDLIKRLSDNSDLYCKELTARQYAAFGKIA